MSSAAVFGKTCKGCEAIFSEEWASGKIWHRCGAPGPRRGYVVGSPRILPYIPAWCPKLTESEENRE